MNSPSLQKNLLNTTQGDLNSPKSLHREHTNLWWPTVMVPGLSARCSNSSCTAQGSTLARSHAGHATGEAQKPCWACCCWWCSLGTTLGLTAAVQSRESLGAVPGPPLAAGEPRGCMVGRDGIPPPPESCRPPLIKQKPNWKVSREKALYYQLSPYLKQQMQTLVYHLPGYPSPGRAAQQRLCNHFFLDLLRNLFIFLVTKDFIPCAPRS